MDDEQEDDDEGGNADADTEDKSDTDKGKGKETERDEPVQTPSLEAELECARARSVINANIAACYVKLVSTSSSMYSRVSHDGLCRRNGRRPCLHAQKVRMQPHS